MKTRRIIFESDFVDEAVFLTIRDREGKGDLELARRFHEGKDRVYSEGDQEGHEDSFRKFYDEQFRELGLQNFFENVVAQFPLIDSADLQVIFRRAWGQREEGAELYVRSEMKTVTVGIQTVRVKDPCSLEAFLRYEFMHISDMLDPEFGYSPFLPFESGSAAGNDLVRERFRILWDLYTSARMRKTGFKDWVPLERQKELFERAFMLLDNKHRAPVFFKLLQGGKWTQRELLEIAVYDRTEILT